MNSSPSQISEDARLQFQGGTLLLQGLTARAVDRVFARLAWVWDERVRAWRVDAFFISGGRDRLVPFGPSDHRRRAAMEIATLAHYEVIRIPVHRSSAERQRYDVLSREVRQYMFERRKNDPSFTWENLCSETGAEPEARRALQAYRAKKSIEDRAEEKLRVLEDLFRLHVGEPCIVFVGSNAMARDVSRRFLVPCLLSHCGKKERLDVLDGLEQGRYPVLVANRVLDEGVDLPEVKVAIVIGGSASGRQAKQRLGRILRKRGGIRATLYEIVTADTGEVDRSRRRRDTDAYQGTRHRRI